MSAQVTRLKNGLRVVSDFMPHAESVALGVWVAVGARHEKESEHGISHMLEHMAFKGTERRSASDIAEQIEAVGGELNAATSLETTSYYSRVLPPDIGLALDIVADIMLIPRYDEADLQREREVILQEIAGTRDSPDELGYELLQDAAFHGQSIGRSILGTVKSVKRHSADDIRTFLKANYGATRMVLSAAGKVEHDAVVRHAEALFGKLNGGDGGRFEPARYIGGLRSSAKPFEQSHLLMAFPAPSYRQEEFYTAQVFSGLFGGGMSSRLFQEVRERRGLCYAIYSSCYALADAGLFDVHAATGAEMMGRLIDVVGAELKRAASDVPTPGEMQRSKAQLKAGLLMGSESTMGRAEQMARQLLVFDRLIETPELVERIESVTPEATRTLAAKLLNGAPPCVAVVGAGRKGEEYARQAERVTQA